MAPAPDLWVHHAVIERLEAVRPRPWEVGGWLLGYWSGGTAITITHATPPASRGTPFGVTVSGRGHRDRFDQAWDSSNGKVTDLGDWHTHPGGPVRPSSRDRRASSQIAGDPDFRTPQPLLAIVATGRWPGSRQPVRTKFFVRRDDELMELNPMQFSELPVEVRVPQWV
jgi:integrative and conjugative element protein (TIGR02256 family)